MGSVVAGSAGAVADNGAAAGVTAGGVTVGAADPEEGPGEAIADTDSLAAVALASAFAVGSDVVGLLGARAIAPLAAEAGARALVPLAAEAGAAPTEAATAADWVPSVGMTIFA